MLASASSAVSRPDSSPTASAASRRCSSAVLQGVALVPLSLFDGLVSLYVISALFGLFQGGIVPMYAIIVREYFAAERSGTRLGIVLMATLSAWRSAAGCRA